MILRVLETKSDLSMNRWRLHMESRPTITCSSTSKDSECISVTSAKLCSKVEEQAINPHGVAAVMHSRSFLSGGFLGRRTGISLIAAMMHIVIWKAIPWRASNLHNNASCDIKQMHNRNKLYLSRFITSWNTPCSNAHKGNLSGEWKRECRLCLLRDTCNGYSWRWYPIWLYCSTTEIKFKGRRKNSWIYPVTQSPSIVK